MSIATLFGIAVIGTLFWVASPEAAVALFASKQEWSPAVIAAVAAGGQAVSLTLLFLFGGSCGGAGAGSIVSANASARASAIA
jgi:hypothetical protein